MGDVVRIARRGPPKLLKFGRISEKDGLLHFEGFVLDGGHTRDSADVALIKAIIRRLQGVLRS